MHRSALLALPFCLVSAAVAQTNFPPPVPPPGNPITTEKALLGMALFFEEQMSSSDMVACATCHDLARGGVDAREPALHPGPDGVFGTADDILASRGVANRDASGLVAEPRFGLATQVTNRRSPTVINTGYHPSLFYDGRATSGMFRDPITNLFVLGGNVALENLVLGPPVNAVEMGHVGRTWSDVVQKLAIVRPLIWASDLPQRLQDFVKDDTYPLLFERAFGSPGLTPTRVAMAIATYLRTLNSDQSKYDQFLAGTATLTPQEQHGLQLFNTPINGATSCKTCHGDFEPRVRQEGPIAGQIVVVTTGYYGGPTNTRLLFHNIGLRPPAEDPGRQGITTFASDAGRFRTASLRNVELTAPYFHNGSAATLRDVIEFYDRGGDFHQNQAPSLVPRGYTQVQFNALEAILLTLTDSRLAQGIEPFDRPRLGSQTRRFVEPIGPGMTTATGTSVVAEASHPAQLGESRFSLTLSGTTPGAFSLLLFDLQSAVPYPEAYNLAIALSPAMVCVPVGPSHPVGTRGVRNVPMPLPSHASFRGLLLYAQWVSLENSGTSSIVTSNGLRIELQ